MIETPAPRVYIGDIRVDASISEKHSLVGEITSHKVERGADVTDHYRSLPKTISITGVISNTQIAPATPSEVFIDSARSSEAGNNTPALDAWNRLKDIFKNKELVTIKTSLETYTSMALVNISVTRGSHNGDNLRFSAVAKEVIFTTAEYTDKIKIPKTTRGKKKKKVGSETTTESPFVPLNEELPPTKLEKTLTEDMTMSEVWNKFVSVPGS